MGLTQEERSYFQLSDRTGWPCLSEEEEKEALLETFSQALESLEGDDCGTECLPTLVRVARPAYALAGVARTLEEAADLYAQKEPGSTFHYEGQNEPLSPLSLYHFARYRGTIPASE